MTLLRQERSREVICEQLYKKPRPIAVTLLKPERSREIISEQQDKNPSPIIATLLRPERSREVICEQLYMYHFECCHSGLLAR